MDDGIGDGAEDNTGPSFGVIYGTSHHRDCDCDVDWCIDDILGDFCYCYYYYYYYLFYYYIIIIIG